MGATGVRGARSMVFISVCFFPCVFTIFTFLLYSSFFMLT